MIKKLLLSIFFATTIIAPVAVSAASVDVLDDVCKRAGVDPNNPKPNDPAACVDRVGDSKKEDQNPIYGPNGIITKIVNILTILVGITAVIAIIIAGIKFITSGSNPQEVTKAREFVIYAIVGLILAALAQIIVRYVLANVV